MTAPDDTALDDLADALYDAATAPPAVGRYALSRWQARLLAARLTDYESARTAVLDALDHGDCVPRETSSPLSECDHGVTAWRCPTCIGAEGDYQRDRAERAEAREARLREALGEADNLASEADRGDVSVYLGGAIDDYKRVRAALEGGEA